MRNDRRFYVYGYIRLDNYSYFYIGKGTGRRYLDLSHSRTDDFKNIVNNIETTVEILYDNLTEEEALYLERETIEDLIYNEGYSIQIRDFCDINEGYHLTNHSLGGRGTLGYKSSEEELKERSERYKGEKNPFYGKHHNEETKRKLSEIRKDYTGEKHPMYGKRGDKSPIKGRKHSEEEIEKMSINNPLRKEVYCIELDISFTSLTKAEKYMQETYNIPFGRRALAKRLAGEILIDWYGEINIDGELIKLHWKYI